MGQNQGQLFRLQDYSIILNVFTKKQQKSVPKLIIATINIIQSPWNQIYHLFFDIRSLSELKGPKIF